MILGSPQTVSSATVPTYTTPVKQEVSNSAVVNLIKETALKEGVDPKLAIAISTCESSLSHFDQDGNVLSGIVNSQDKGVFQINLKYHLEDSKKLGYDVMTPEGNIGYAIRLLKIDGSKHWRYSQDCWKKLI